MPPEKLEELLRQMNQPKVVHTLREGNHDGEDLDENLIHPGPG
ncbi:MAG TPA: hypothetical protein VF767_05590 [Bryobacteraceae bacterium]